MAEKAVSKATGRSAIGQSARSKDVITMFTVKRDMAKVLVDYKLPADAEVAIVSSKPSSAKRIEKALGPKVARRAELVARALGARYGTETAVDKSAFEPDARSRAILEGVRIAQEDLREAGGAYDLEQVRTLMRGVSRQAVDKRVHEGSLIAVPGPSNRRAFPTVQFKRDGTVVPGLKAVCTMCARQESHCNPSFPEFRKLVCVLGGRRASLPSIPHYFSVSDLPREP